MARVNVYLPDDLAEEVRHAAVNVSGITQAALREELDARRTTAWLDRVGKLVPTDVAHAEVVDALDEVRAEAGDEWPARATRRSATRPSAAR